MLEPKVVLEGITVGAKTLREHFEATNHRDAILYVENIVFKREELPILVVPDTSSLFQSINADVRTDSATVGMFWYVGGIAESKRYPS